jgi:hypothetical protein
MISNYRKHLNDRKRRTRTMNGAVADSALSRSLLRIVFLDTPEGVAAFGDAVVAGWPALLDMGATYGTAFLDSVRPDVADARHESQQNLVTVSIVARLSEARGWIDLERLHPTFVTAIEQGLLSKLQRIVFMRFPANERGRGLGRYCVNEQDEIQVMFYPEDDAVLTYLAQTHNTNYFEVRSSNITGLPEEPFAPGAVEYACTIAAPIVAVSSFGALEAQMIDQVLYKQQILSQMRRKRFGSFPIARFDPPGESASPTLSIVRAGNTSPDTLARFFKGCLPGVNVIYREEKKGHARHEYESPFDDPQDIQKDLLRAASEVGNTDLDRFLDQLA